jgi:PEP-CTERM motif-containing protein
MRTFVKAAAFAFVSVWCATAPATASAQVQMQFGSGGPYADGHFAVGPYTGTENGAPITLNCVDFFHEVVVGETWTANVTSLGSGDLSNTRYGNAGRDNYEEQAFLTTFYASAAGNNAEIAAIQHAIWSLASGKTVSDFPTYIQNDLNNETNSKNVADYWVDFANGHYTQVADGFYNQFQIVTDVRKDYSNSAQEFITTPEPGSVALLGTGLFGLIPMVRRRRKQSV